ncbi:murein L,D-transpeptidase catalytic domain family protein [Bergeyella sp. RCAD1439]|uniref:murein L,D-transpeptidase catalytic domain family protein n=1 Tax=Bergeyella anatis TaxID=3113737 RepID=UPI002E193310|nr:murein L,D-transpeptidase catalytic domain family protein [Bergeyella sp. RCAD1439]
MKKIIMILGMVVFASAFSSLSKESAVLDRAHGVDRDSVVEKTERAISESDFYDQLNFDGKERLSEEVFAKAFQGFKNLKEAGEIDSEAKLLTVCDFSLSSNRKRLWVINTVTGEVVFNSLVAHGKNTGEEYAVNFSNKENSYQSSIGFYVTEQPYFGENGYSLRLSGKDEGYNDRAMQRAIVLHGADYVSEDFAVKHRRIGRSWGCPAVPRALAEPMIDAIKGKSVLFIYYPDRQYLENSVWLKG